MDKTVLLTRPLIAAEQDAFAWQRAGFKMVIAPLLKINFIPQTLPDLRDYQAVITTSAVAIQALSTLTERRDVLLWCVGQASATVAKSLGFKKVFTPSLSEELPPRPSFGLLTALLQSLNPRNGPIFYAAGAVVHLDLSTSLREHGYIVEKAVLYETQPELSSLPKIQSFFEKPVIGGATFYSKRTAMIFKDYVNSQKGFKIKENCYPLCLSPSIAAIVQPFFSCPSIITSTTEQLIANLKKIL
jgi:uroporphyrinogen-III synthase